MAVLAVLAVTTIPRKKEDFRSHYDVRANKSIVLDNDIACGKSGSEASFLGNNTEI